MRCSVFVVCLRFLILAVVLCTLECVGNNCFCGVFTNLGEKSEKWLIIICSIMKVMFLRCLFDFPKCGLL